MLEKSLIALSQNKKIQPKHNSTQLMHELSEYEFMPTDKNNILHCNHSFQVQPSITVSRSGQAKPLERALITPSEIYKTNFNGRQLGPLLCAPLSSIKAMMLIKQGKVIFEHFNSPYHQQHAWMDCANIIIGTLIAALVITETIDAQAPLKKYIPELSTKDWGDILIIDILNMQSGMNISMAPPTT